MKLTRRRNFFIPKMISDMMMALTKNSTSLFFGCKHHCIKHASPINIDHIESCSLFEGFGGLRAFVQKLKALNIRDWPPAEATEAMLMFKTLAEQVQVMEQMGLAKFEQRSNPSPVEGTTKRPRGRPKKIVQPSSEGLSKYFNRKSMVAKNKPDPPGSPAPAATKQVSNP